MTPSVFWKRSHRQKIPQWLQGEAAPPSLLVHVLLSFALRLLPSAITAATPPILRHGTSKDSVYKLVIAERPGPNAVYRGYQRSQRVAARPLTQNGPPPQYEYSSTANAKMCNR
jgi:hypothetical protein